MLLREWSTNCNKVYFDPWCETAVYVPGMVVSVPGMDVAKRPISC